ncbi:MAG TPA: hypothetical protein VLL82_03340, partial [Mycobacterium sp.]|nr:hypothetical protein [Mycobacterium sp.]
MRSNMLKAALIKSGLAASVLLLASGASFGQVNLTAGPTTLTLPDGNVVPMWGYSCGTLVSAATATCRALNPASVTAVATATTAATGTWSPVVITVPYSESAPGVSTTSLTINLINNLTFPAGTGTNTVPTSLVIVGQLGGGLGTAPTRTPSPGHASQSVTWSTVSAAPLFTPPTQGDRVQSFATEVVAAGVTAVAPQVASGSALTWNALRPGTYLIESGTHPSIQGPMGLYGVLVVTTAPVGAGATGTAYGALVPSATAPSVTYNADVPLEFSEIDAVQNKAVDTAVRTAGFSETRVWSGQPGMCGNPASAVGVVNTCYPPAVNFTPLYYLVNGVAFNKAFVATTASPNNPSLFPTNPATSLAAGTGTILVRMVNAGLRMHLPSIVGAQTAGVSGAGAAATVNGFALVAEDGNPVPGALGGKPRVQSDVFMAAGKTYDVKINVPAAGTTALAVYDRELSLSGNAIARDAGMLAYIGANGAALPNAASLAPAVARNDLYNSVVTGQTLVVSDPSKGVIANDTNVYGVTVVGTVAGLTLNPNGTFTYTG